MTIYEFKKGDEIVRIKPSKPYSGGECDRSYMGEKLIYVGVANGQIYLKRTDPVELKIFGDKLIDLDIDMWDDGWEFYVNPETLFEDDIMTIDLNTLSERLNNAIESEDYELATKIKKLIENNKNK